MSVRQSPVTRESARGQGRQRTISDAVMDNFTPNPVASVVFSGIGVELEKNAGAFVKMNTSLFEGVLHSNAAGLVRLGCVSATVLAQALQGGEESVAGRARVHV